MIIIELDKYRKVNESKSLTELAEAIRSFAGNAGEIYGRERVFCAETMATHCEEFSLETHNTLTREFGIRQQAMMLIFYRDRK